jgi:hypothetical protein
MDLFGMIFGKPMPSVSAVELSEKLKNGKRPLVLDVRLAEGRSGGEERRFVGRMSPFPLRLDLRSILGGVDSYRALRETFAELKCNRSGNDHTAIFY